MAKYNAATQSIYRLTLIITKIILDDVGWIYFGFKKPPKRGIFFDRFVSKERLAREKFISRELFLLATVDVIEAVKSKDMSESDKLHYITAVLATLYEPLKRGLFFENHDNYLSFIVQGHEDYTSGDFIKTFAARVNKLVDNDDARKRLMGGGAILAAHRQEDEPGLIFIRSEIAKQADRQDISNALTLPLEEKEKSVFIEAVEQILNSK